MKKKKLSLESLKVKSFITKVEKTSSNTVKGGTGRIGTGNACQEGSHFCDQSVYVVCFVE